MYRYRVGESLGHEEGLRVNTSVFNPILGKIYPTQDFRREAANFLPFFKPKIACDIFYPYNFTLNRREAAIFLVF